jgi:hypothetical protein
MNYNNYHVYVMVSTIVFYGVLRAYKQSITNHIYERKANRSSNLIYVLFLPTVLYLVYYLFIIEKKPVSENATSATLERFSEGILTAPYPDSVSL